MEVFGIIPETDVRWEMGAQAGHPCFKPAWCLNEARLLPGSRAGRAGSVESESCTLAVLLWLALAEKWNPDPLRSPSRARTFLPSAPNHPGLGNTCSLSKTLPQIILALFPLFPPPLVSVFIAVCKCQDTYDDAQYKWYFPNYAHMFGFTWVAAECNVVPDAPAGRPPHWGSIPQWHQLMARLDNSREAGGVVFY